MGGRPSLASRPGSAGPFLPGPWPGPRPSPPGVSKRSATFALAGPPDPSWSSCLASRPIGPRPRHSSPTDPHGSIEWEGRAGPTFFVAASTFSTRGRRSDPGGPRSLASRGPRPRGCQGGPFVRRSARLGSRWPTGRPWFPPRRASQPGVPGGGGEGTGGRGDPGMAELGQFLPLRSGQFAERVLLVPIETGLRGTRGRHLDPNSGDMAMREPLALAEESLLDEPTKLGRGPAPSRLGGA